MSRFITLETDGGTIVVNPERIAGFHPSESNDKLSLTLDGHSYEVSQLEVFEKLSLGRTGRPITLAELRAKAPCDDALLTKFVNDSYSELRALQGKVPINMSCGHENAIAAAKLEANKDLRSYLESKGKCPSCTKKEKAG